jgi:hypothetical protein
VAIAGITACSSRPKATIHDAAFARQANSICAKQLPSLRAKKDQSDIFGATPKNNRAATAAKIDKAADGLDRVAAQLAALPVRSEDQTAVAAWLEEWANYTGVGRQYAQAVRTARDSTISSIAAEANGPVHNIAHFARANHIDDCVL